MKYVLIGMLLMDLIDSIKFTLWEKSSNNKILMLSPTLLIINGLWIIYQLPIDLYYLNKIKASKKALMTEKDHIRQEREIFKHIKIRFNCKRANKINKKLERNIIK